MATVRNHLSGSISLFSAWINLVVLTQGTNFPKKNCEGPHITFACINVLTQCFDCHPSYGHLTNWNEFFSYLFTSRLFNQSVHNNNHFVLFTFFFSSVTLMIDLDRPKSDIFNCFCSSMRIFRAARSRCMIPLSSKCFMPRAICTAKLCSSLWSNMHSSADLVSGLGYPI